MPFICRWFLLFLSPSIERERRRVACSFRMLRKHTSSPQYASQLQLDLDLLNFEHFYFLTYKIAHNNTNMKITRGWHLYSLCPIAYTYSVSEICWVYILGHNEQLPWMYSPQRHKNHRLYKSQFIYSVNLFDIQL